MNDVSKASRTRTHDAIERECREGSPAPRPTARLLLDVFLDGVPQLMPALLKKRNHRKRKVGICGLEKGNDPLRLD